MTALTQNVPNKVLDSQFNAIPAASGAVVFEGSMVSESATGYGDQLAVTGKFVGHCYAKADNTDGADGAIDIQVYTGKYRLKSYLSGLAITDVGKKIYATDDNVITLARNAALLVGKVVRFIATGYGIMEYDTEMEIDTYVPELDCQTTIDTAEHQILNAADNKFGMVLMSGAGIITEAMAGGSEDQGIITVYDSDDSALFTLTPTDGAADAIGDYILGWQIQSTATGTAWKTIAAGKGIYAKVTQATSGTGAAGKVRVHVEVKPLI